MDNLTGIVTQIDYDGEAVSGYHVATLHTDHGPAVLTGPGEAVLLVVRQLEAALAAHAEAERLNDLEAG